jgi:hypothetical protein
MAATRTARRQGKIGCDGKSLISRTVPEIPLGKPNVFVHQAYLLVQEKTAMHLNSPHAG